MTASLLERVAERLEQRTDPTPSPALQRFPTPGHLARHVRPDTVQTPMLDLVDDAIVQASRGEHRFWIINTPPQEGKATCGSVPIMSVARDAEVPGQAGFKMMKDIEVGDFVFHPSGRPVEVTWKSPRMDDHSLCRVTTSDGRTLVVDEEHLWTVQDRRKTKSRRKTDGPGYDRWMEWETVTTRDLIDRGLAREKPRQRPDGTWTKANALRLPRQHAIQSADVNLPIEPYLLGLWLADGSHTGAQITEGVVDVEELCSNIEDAGGAIVGARKVSVDEHGWQGVTFGFSLTKRWARDGFLDRARELGILGNKHIPDIYLTAGTQQRLSLLQGLLDGDGAISTNGNTFRVEYTTVIPQLAEQVLFMVRSLGWRATVKDSKATLNGVEKKRRYRVCCTPVQGEFNPFRLARKAARIQVDKSRGGERHVVTIDSIEPVGKGTVYCITVDSEDGLYLAGRDLVSTHNSTRLQAAAAWLLLEDPSRRIVFASYEQGLAQVSGLAVRQMLETFGSGYQGARPDPDRDDVLGLALDPSRGAATAWRLAQTAAVPNPGGVVSVGVGSALTGRPADVLIVDDPIKDAAHADSVKIRKNLKDWWESVASTRLAPDAIVIVVQTRWHEDDLAGWLLAEDEPAAPKWKHLSISAQAFAEDPDAKPPIGPDPLGRKPGEWMVSARGRTVADWEQKRKDIGRGGRWWNAMYQQRPAPPEGGIFQREWFRRDRLHTLPPMRRVVVMVDPADNTGDGDEAGIVVGGTTHDGRHVLMADYSGHYTTDGWFRRAYLAFVHHEANQLQWEVSLSGLRRTAESTWKAMRAEARHLVEAWGEIHGSAFPDFGLLVVDTDVVNLAVARMSREEDNAEDRKTQSGRLIKLWPYVNRLRALPSTGPYIKRPVRAVGSKQLRAELVAPLYENREVSHLGHKLSLLEHEMATWQDGQKSPNRMDAAVHLLRELSRSDGATTVKAAEGTLQRHLGIGAQRPTIGRSSTPRR